MVYAHRFALIQREGDKVVEREWVSAPQMEAALARLPGDLAAEGAAQWAGLQASHAPLQLPVRDGAARTIRLDQPQVMGILNMTPDSFSDGGRFFDTEAAIEQGLRLAADGADILDIGGQSTRPGSNPVSPDEELRRVIPVIESLVSQCDVPISIDTDKAVVAREAADAGTEIINDITALLGDDEMTAVAVDSNCGICAMHMQGTPRTMQRDPVYEDPIAEVYEFLARRRDAIQQAGISLDRIALDVGIGFGKTTEHNLQLLRNIDKFKDLGCPLLVGPSRKRFIGEVLGDMETDRTAGTVGVAVAMALAGVEVLRVHDVAQVRSALMLFDVVRSRWEPR